MAVLGHRVRRRRVKEFILGAGNGDPGLDARSGHRDPRVHGNSDRDRANDRQQPRRGMLVARPFGDIGRFEQVANQLLANLCSAEPQPAAAAR
jgi:hypothetical protein